MNYFFQSRNKILLWASFFIKPSRVMPSFYYYYCYCHYNLNKFPSPFPISFYFPRCISFTIRGQTKGKNESSEKSSRAALFMGRPRAILYSWHCRDRSMSSGTKKRLIIIRRKWMLISITSADIGGHWKIFISWILANTQYFNFFLF